MLENVTLREKKAYYYGLLGRQNTLLDRKDKRGELPASEEIELACIDAQIAFLQTIIPDNER